MSGVVGKGTGKMETTLLEKQLKTKTNKKKTNKKTKITTITTRELNCVEIRKPRR